MFSTKYQDFRARIIHTNLHPPAENLSDCFGNKTGDHIYMPLTNPTNKSFKHTSASLVNVGALVTSSGMAAITNACMALLRVGEESSPAIPSLYLSLESTESKS